jgi:hypothetical protein
LVYLKASGNEEAWIARLAFLWQGEEEWLWGAGHGPAPLSELGCRLGKTFWPPKTVKVDAGQQSPVRVLSLRTNFTERVPEVSPAI